MKRKIIIDNNDKTIILDKLFQNYNTLLIQNNILVRDCFNNEYKIIFYYKQSTPIFTLVDPNTKELFYRCCTCLTLKEYIKNLIRRNFEVFFDYEG